jgi:uncharacterized protein (TIGR02391 family)
MPTLEQLIPDADVVLALTPEELGWAVLRCLKSQAAQHTGPPSMKWRVAPGNFANGLAQRHPPAYPVAVVFDVQRAVMAGFSWLMREGLITPSHEPSEYGAGTYFISKRGQELATEQQFDDFRKATMLPKELLHSRIADLCWVSFLRAEYSTAVFQAFKEVEVAVRSAGGFPNTDYGTDLMRKAFHPDNGPLTRTADVKAEREALASLFAGAVGSYKNPHSHRSVVLDSPTDAVEMILLASHLLRIVDSRAGQQPANSHEEVVSG